MESRVLAPAKVNLSLLVGPRDEAGYHEVFTVLASVGVYDDLEFRLTAGPAGEVSNEVDVECNTAPGRSNLAARALRALQDFTGWSFNGRVIIRKSIPVGAGLGGGSSDAAAALMAGVEALAEMGGPLPERSELAAIARKVGADVPFFLDPRPAIGRGIGELLEPVELPELWLALVIFDTMLSTVSVYRSFDGLRPCVSSSFFERRTTQAEARWREAPDAGAVARLLENDLERASFTIFPSLAGAREILIREGALGALMSGSGPTLFGLCASRSEAEGLAGRLERRGLQGRVTRVDGTRSSTA